MNNTEDRCKKLLTQEGIDINSEIDFDVNGKVHTLSFLYIIETFMEASNTSQTVFFTALEKSLDVKEIGVDRFFENMGQLLLMTHLSEKI
ncbi:MAG: hypothetical protein WC667_12330 [Sulfurimonas sp.]|jgi:hypothetical protein